MELINIYLICIDKVDYSEDIFKILLRWPAAVAQYMFSWVCFPLPRAVFIRHSFSLATLSRQGL